MNSVNLVGRLTKNPELNYTKTNKKAVTNFTLAIRKGSNTSFINVVAWNKTAEFVCKYFIKGKRIAVTGSLQSNQKKDSNNVTHYNVEILADDVFFADGNDAISDNADSEPNDE